MAQLTIQERFDLQKYTGLLLSTIALRMEIENCWRELSFTEEEYSTYRIEADGLGIKYTDHEYRKEIGAVSPVVLNAMAFHIADNAEGNAEDPTYLAAVQSFKLVLGDNYVVQEGKN